MSTEKFTLDQFICLNLSNSNLFDSYYTEDRDLILNTLYDKNFKINDGESFLDKFKCQFVKPKVLRNYQIALDRIKTRQLLQGPNSGDEFIDDNGTKYRIVGGGFRGPLFQFCHDGSFHMGTEGHSSMSGGFEFDIPVNGKKIGSINQDDLTEVESSNARRFWFFMDNRSGGNRGLYFYCPVRMFKSKAK